MARGIIYVMTTAVPGLIKIGKTGLDNFEQRMYNLEKNGYCNVTALKRKFAIEVDDYDDKEKLLDDIFDKSRVYNTELFALDVDMVVQLLSSLDGTQVYPKEKSKGEVFDEATKERNIKLDTGYIPDGEYFLVRRVKDFGEVKGNAVVEDGIFKVLKGSICGPTRGDFVPEIRKNACIIKDILQEDVACSSPTSAGWVVLGASNNGWTEWKDKSGRSIDIFRKNTDN